MWIKQDDAESWIFHSGMIISQGSNANYNLTSLDSFLHDSHKSPMCVNKAETIAISKADMTMTPITCQIQTNSWGNVIISYEYHPKR